MDVKKCSIKNNVSPGTVSFKARINEAHAHSGAWPCDKANFTSEILNNLFKDSFEVNINGKIQTDEVEKVLLSNLACLDISNEKPPLDELKGNQELIDSCKGYSKLKPLVVCQPEWGSVKNIETILQNNPQKIYGFKLHPRKTDEGLHPNYESYLKLAEKYNMPCVFHSGAVGSGSDPNLIYQLAKKTPKIPVILYHMSLAPAGRVADLSQEEKYNRDLFGQEDKYIWDVREKWNNDGIDVVSKALKAKDANLFLEVSWVKPETVIHAINKVGEDRVIFGTDAPLGEFANKYNYANHVSKIKSAIQSAFEPNRAEEIIDKVFYRNTQELFFDKNWSKELTKNLQKQMQHVKKPEFSLARASEVFASFLYRPNLAKSFVPVKTAGLSVLQSFKVNFVKKVPSAVSSFKTII